MSEDKSNVARAMTNDGAFRFIACNGSAAASEAITRQRAVGEAAQHLAELIVSSVLVRETTAPNRRLQMRLEPAAASEALIADTFPDGRVRGLVRPADPANANILQVTYSTLSGDMHQSVIESSHDSSVQETMMQYLQESEQIISVIRLHYVADARQAAGFVVQLLPEAERDDIAAMTKHITEAIDVASDLPWHDPTAVIAALAGEHEYTMLSESEIRFGCSCDRGRFIAGIASLPRTDIDEMVRDAKPLEVVCDACGEKYAIEPQEVVAFISGDN